MWSDALRILDENTMKLYVEELEEKLQNALETNELEKARGQEMLRQIAEEKEADIRRITAEKDAQIAVLEKNCRSCQGTDSMMELPGNRYKRRKYQGRKRACNSFSFSPF